MASLIAGNDCGYLGSEFWVFPQTSSKENGISGATFKKKGRLVYAVYGALVFVRRSSDRRSPSFFFPKLSQ